MKGRYILLLGDSSNSQPLDEAMRSIGMRCRLQLAWARLFVSLNTSIFELPGVGLIIGHLFNSDGEPITHLDFNGTVDDLIQHLLHKTWGEYLLINMANGDGRNFTLLRDPSGDIPCIYSLENGEGFITSDIALATELGIYHREVNWHAVAHGLAFPYLRTARTALERVSELLPGSTLTCRGHDVFTQTAWSPWHFVSPDVRHTNPRAAAAEVRAAISGVIKTLSAQDERFIVELSGGLDSSIVATCLRESSSRATFCTLVMPIAGTDERPYAELVTDTLGCELLPVEVGFDNIHFQFPVLSSAISPAVGILQQAVNEVWETAANRHGVDSFFSGGGGDTVFCYLKTAAPAADAFKERGAMAGFTAIRDLSALHQCTIWKAGRLTLRKLWRRSPSSWKRDTTFLNLEWVPAVPEHHPWLDSPSHALPGDREKIQDLAGTRIFREATPRGQGRAMRFPLLSQPVMEACLKVPTWMWISGGRNRSIARDAFSDLLPQDILDRRSKGSYSGYMAAVYARNKDGMQQFLEDGELCAHGLLDRSAITAFFAKELAPRDLSFLRIFDLCTAENWVRQQTLLYS